MALDELDHYIHLVDCTYAIVIIILVEDFYYPLSYLKKLEVYGM